MIGTDRKLISKAEAKRRLIRAEGMQTISFGFYNKDRAEWIPTRVANPDWRRLDKVQSNKLNFSGSWVDLDSNTEVFEVDDTTLMLVWTFPNGDLLSRSTVSLVPMDY
jgi:hypothetical protein